MKNIKIYVQENDVQQFPIMLQSLGENTLETGFLMTWLKFSCAARTTWQIGVAFILLSVAFILFSSLVKS